MSVRLVGVKPRTLAGCVAVLTLLSVGLTLADVLVGVAIGSWLLSIVGLVMLGLAADGLTPTGVIRSARALLLPRHRSELGSVLAITAVALVLRCYDLD